MTYIVRSLSSQRNPTTFRDDYSKTVHNYAPEKPGSSITIVLTSILKSKKLRTTSNTVPVKKTDGKAKSVIIEQQLIVSYSIKYRDYLRSIRNRQVTRAESMIASGSKEINRKRQTDPKRFIKTNYATSDGEVADISASFINDELIATEEMYDGFYAVCTNLEDTPESIIKINKRRWEIEECFRIMKSDFEARPVYVKRQERILAHFITCFISDSLHEAFGFCTSKQIIPTSKMRNICSQTKHSKK